MLSIGKYLFWALCLVWNHMNPDPKTHTRKLMGPEKRIPPDPIFMG